MADMQPQWFPPADSAARRDQDQPTDQSSELAYGQPSEYQGALSTPTQVATRELGVRAGTLLKRLREVEEALTDQEWWLMGRAMPEARVLSEMTSLLSVARGELETFLAAVGSAHEDPNSVARRKEQEDVFDLMSDPMWMSGSREKAVALLRMCGMQIQPMRQYAQVLLANAEKLRLPAIALDPLGITAERLGEAEELLRQSPR
ncbi:MAG: hypothetical protein ACHQ1E_01315 [Ktedonobacterales bacterium]|jgi:hypothetical protein